MTDTPSTVFAIDRWSSNADLIADAAKLGYIYGEVLDCTYGYGTFWQKFRPAVLLGTDIDPTKCSPEGVGSVDFTNMPFGNGSFDCRGWTS